MCHLLRLDPAAVDALASIGDGERVRYLDFRDALHDGTSRQVSAPAVRAVLTACAASGGGRGLCEPEPHVSRPSPPGETCDLVDHAPSDNLAAAEGRAAAGRFWNRPATRALSHAFVLSHHDSQPHLAREAVLSRVRLFGDGAWVCVVDQGAASRPGDRSARDLVAALRNSSARPERLLLASGTTTHELSAYARGVRAIVAAAEGFPDLWLFTHATVVVRPFPRGRLPPCGVARLGPSPIEQ